MRGNRDSALREHKQIPVSAETPEKGTGTLQETEPNLPASVGGPPVEAWVSRGSPQGWRYWQQLSGKVPFVNLTIELGHLRPKNQQIIGLKRY